MLVFAVCTCIKEGAVRRWIQDSRHLIPNDEPCHKSESAGSHLLSFNTEKAPPSPIMPPPKGRKHSGEYCKERTTQTGSCVVLWAVLSCQHHEARHCTP
jgi:hypothetical protein